VAPATQLPSHARRSGAKGVGTTVTTTRPEARFLLDGSALFPSGRDFLDASRKQKGTRGAVFFPLGGIFYAGAENIRGRGEKGEEDSGSGRSATRLVLSWFSYVPDGVFGFSHGGLLRQWQMRAQASMYIFRVQPVLTAAQDSLLRYSQAVPLCPPYSPYRALGVCYHTCPGR